MTPRVVVVGGGIGGTAAALLLADRGLDVILVDKNPRIGGSCSGYEKRGFHIDVGTHLFCRGDRGPLGEVLRRVGEPGAIGFRRTRDIAEIRSVGRQGHLERVAIPAALRRVPRFAWSLARTLELTPREAANVARLFAHILTMPEPEVERWDAFTVEAFLAAFTDSDAVVCLFGFLLGLYFVVPYWEVSAGEALWCFRRMARDNALSYPRGGSIAIPGTYASLAEARGAQVRTGVGVERIVVRDGRVRSVVLDDGEELRADVVISTSSLRTTALRLVGREHLPETWVASVEAIRGSAIAVQAKIALDRPLVQAGAIVGGVGDAHDLLRLRGAEMRSMFEQVQAGRVPDVVPFYCPVPTNFDPSLAPEGHQLLTVCALAPTSDVPLTDPPAAWEEAMLRAIRRVVPGLDDHVVFIDRLSVGFIERWIGKEHGPAISTAQIPGQVGASRPPVSTPIHGLYVAGCCAGGRGVGTELAATSAMLCADRVLADLGRPLRAAMRAPLPLRAADAAVRPLAWATAPR